MAKTHYLLVLTITLLSFLFFSPFAFAQEAVDLGLSVKWATCDLGATSPEEDGNRYAWGDIMPKTNKRDDASSNMRIDVRKKYHDVDCKTQLDLSDDAAYQELGENWRIPTKKECDELLANCNFKRTTKNGVSGYLFISKKNGKSIFFADEHHYWTSSLNTKGAHGGQVYYEAWAFTSGNEFWIPDKANTPTETAGRRMPRSIRPVYDPRSVSSNIRSQSSSKQSNTKESQQNKLDNERSEGPGMWRDKANVFAITLRSNGSASVKLTFPGTGSGSYPTTWKEDNGRYIVGGIMAVSAWILYPNGELYTKDKDGVIEKVDIELYKAW